MQHLVLVGASVRAAAESALRAGLAPWCADLFADADLRAIVPDVVRCPIGDFPHAFAEIVRSAPDGPWMYTGGLENYPDLIREISQERHLWGNDATALAACRSPRVVEQCLREAGLPALQVLSANDPVPDLGRWLRKPLRGSAGLGISMAKPQSDSVPSDVYFQEFVEGVSMSAVFVAARGVSRLLGVTEQLIGTDWLNAPPFRYAGNIGPVDLSSAPHATLLKIGQTLTAHCGLLGLFGVDFILKNGLPWVVEVNPRYPASAEVLERASGISMLGWHRSAFDSDSPTPPPSTSLQRMVGKAIVYARKKMVIAKDFPPIRSLELAAAGSTENVEFADIPHVGEVIEAGWPVVTIFAEGITRDECIHALEMQASDVL